MHGEGVGERNTNLERVRERVREFEPGRQTNR